MRKVYPAVQSQAQATAAQVNSFISTERARRLPHTFRPPVPTVSIVCESCGWRERYAVVKLIDEHGAEAS
jgi:hypothetical protein